jgi:tight adherence protein B
MLALTSSPALTLLAGFAVLAGFWIYLKQKVDRVVTAFEQQFVDALELAARSLRAGHPLIASFRIIADEVAAPVGTMFQRICQQQAVGISLEQSLREAAAATSSPDMKLFATSVAIQLRSGGNLADMMDRLSAVVRGRMWLTRRVRVLTAQTQLSKRLLLVLPALLFGVLTLLNPGYMHPLYATATGRVLLVVAGLSLLFGAWLMSRMAVLKY